MLSIIKRKKYYFLYIINRENIEIFYNYVGNYELIKLNKINIITVFLNFRYFSEKYVTKFFFYQLNI